MLLGSDHGNVASAKAPPFPAGSAATEEQPPQALWLKRRWGSGTKSTGGGMHGRFVYPCGFEYFPYNVEFGPVVRCQHPHPGPSWLRALQTLPRPVCSPPSASPPSTPSRPPPPPPRRRRAADDDERLVMPSHGVEPASPYEGINACGRIKEQMSDEGPKKFSKPARTSAAIYAVVQRSRKANLPANRKVYRGGSGAR